MNPSNGTRQDAADTITTVSAAVAPASAIVPPGTGHASGPAGPASGPAAAQPNLAEEARDRHAQGRMRGLAIDAEYHMKRRVRHPDGGHRTVEQIVRDEALQRADMEEEARNGSLKHRVLAAWLGWIPKLVLLIDLCQLLYFMSGVTNVDWASPISVNLALATVIAAMITVTSYGFLAFTGDRMRGFKDHAGTVHLSELDGFTKAALVLSAVVIAAIAALMFIRMRTEVLYALGPQATGIALVIGCTLAIVNIVANFLVVAIHALNGSDQVARLNRLSRAARRSVHKAHRMRRSAARHGIR
jgi:hypothetical protein